jgi:Fe2+ transport system protein FeoA
VDEKKAEGWLEKLERGRVLMEGWPKYYVGLDKGALVVRYHSTNPNSIEREKQRLENMGLVKGVHFTVKMPEGGDAGYLYIRREGLAYAAGSPSTAAKISRGSWRRVREAHTQRAEEAGARRSTKSQGDRRGGQVVELPNAGAL